MIRFLQTPGKAKKFLLGALLLLICVSMVLYLVPQGGDPFVGRTDVLAKVGDDRITIADVQRENRGRPLAPQETSRVVDDLVTSKALALEAQRIGFRVTDSELTDDLKHGQYGQIIFPKGEYIGDAQLENLLSNANVSMEQFLQGERLSLLVRKLESMVNGAVTVSPEEIQREFQRQNLKVKLEYAVINTDDVAKQIKPADAELKSYFDSHKAVYANALPEKRKARYVVIDLAKLQAQQRVSPEDLQRYYNQHKEEYRQQEQVKASHILVKTPPAGADGKTDPKALQAAQAKAEGLLAKLRAGANFEELAKKNSDDKGSALQGGSLGWFQREAMVPEFANAAFSTPKGQLSGVVKSPFGYHIIRVDDKRQAGLQPLETVRAQIEPLLLQQKTQQAADSLANTLQTEARAQGLDAAAAKHDLQVVNADWFSRSDSLPGIGAAPDFMETLFAAREKSPPSSARTAQGYAIFQIAGIQPAATPTFNQIRDQVERDYKNERARTLLTQKAQELADVARASHDLKRAAKEVGATLKTSELVGLQNQVPDLGGMSGAASVAFALNPGAISDPIPSSRGQAVLRVTQRQEPNPAELEKSKGQIYETVLRRERGQIFQLYIASLKQRLEKEGKIKINREEVNALSKRAALGS